MSTLKSEFSEARRAMYRNVIDYFIEQLRSQVRAVP